MNRYSTLRVGIPLVVIAGLAAWGYSQFGTPARDAGVPSPHAADKPPNVSQLASSRSAPTTENPNPAVSRENAAPANVDSDFESTRDYFHFVQSRAKEALAGDARSQYYIAKAVQECRVVRKLYGQPTTDPLENARLSMTSANYGKSREAIVERVTKRIERCAGFFQGDPFEGVLPQRAEGYPHDYWMQRALDAKDPLASLDRATDIASNLYPSGAAPPDFKTSISEIRQLVMQGVATGEASAMMRVGYLLSNRQISTDTSMGIAWLLAGCQSGYDCSPNAQDPCVSAGTCGAPTYDMPESLRRSLPSAQYSKAVAQAQDIANLMTAHNTVALDEYLPLKK